jgi:hypothetical protein
MNDIMGTAEDIASYIKHRMEGIVQQHSHLSIGWPGEVKLQELNCRAEQLFIWASVACNFVEDGRNPARQLSKLLNVSGVIGRVAGSSLTHLDLLYTRVLENGFSGEDGLEDFHYVVGAIAAVIIPLTQIGLDALIGLEGGEKPVALPDGHLIHLSSSSTVLSPLRSILMGEFDGTGTRQSPVQLLHPSLHDFLTSHAEEHFRINCLEQHRILAYRCLTVMNSRLKYDICSTVDPYLLNSDIQDQHQHSNDCINEAVHYSCCYFAYHLVEVSDLNENLVQVLETFISQHLLHWVEVMSLVGEISRAEKCLQFLAKWMKVGIHT